MKGGLLRSQRHEPQTSHCPLNRDNFIVALAEQLLRDWDAIIRNKSAIVQKPWSLLATILRVRWTRIPAGVYSVILRAYELAQITPDDNFREHVQGFAATKTAFNTLAEFSESIVKSRVPVPPAVLRAAIPFVASDDETYHYLLLHPNADTTVLRASISLAPTIRA